MLSRKKKVESVRNEQLNPIAMPQRGRYGAINMHKAPYTREKIHRDVSTSNTPPQTHGGSTTLSLERK